jgi:drug/metabolite transporter (DMT)-like permease
LLLALLWGSAFAFIKLALESFTPLGVGFGRMVLGLGALAIASAITRTRFPPRALWFRIAVTALLASSIPWSLVAFAETHISSALTSIIGSAIPLTTLLIVLVFFREERPTAQRIAGLFVGFGGILVVIGVWKGMGAATLIGVAACFVANTSFAFSLPYARRHLTGGAGASSVPPLSLATGLFMFAAIETMPFALFGGVLESPMVMPAVAGILALGGLSSGLAYFLNFRIINWTDVTTASTVTYLIPVVAVIIGMIFLGEEVTWNQPVGGLVILAGAVLAQGLVTLPPRRRAPSRA